MPNPKLSRQFTIGLILFTTFVMFAAPQASAQTESILYSFTAAGADGANPGSGLIFDQAGNLFGTTQQGGPHVFGTVFELSPQSGGGWTEIILHDFLGNGIDGFLPQASLVFDASGNLYGTTTSGGGYGYGTVFQLSPSSNVVWKEKVVHNFNHLWRDSYSPSGQLVFDGAGNLYDDALGGAFGAGTVFELSPGTGGTWVETILYSFDDLHVRSAPKSPLGGVVFDLAGNLYGTTFAGGTYGLGTVFELSPQPGGGWSENTLHSFTIGGADGQNPGSGVVLDTSGNLYGTTEAGGAYNSGTVFRLQPQADGTWKESILHTFNPNTTDGVSPIGGLVLDGSGNLYGTTEFGGANKSGTVFKLTPQTGGAWKESLVYSFGANATDGVNPVSNVILDASGNLYGTTTGGGTHGHGTVYKITP